MAWVSGFCTKQCLPIRIAISRGRGVDVVGRADRHRVDAACPSRRASCGSRCTSSPWETSWPAASSLLSSTSQMATMSPCRPASLRIAAPLAADADAGHGDPLVGRFALRRSCDTGGNPKADPRAAVSGLKELATIGHGKALLRWGETGAGLVTVKHDPRQRAMQARWPEWPACLVGLWLTLKASDSLGPGSAERRGRGAPPAGGVWETAVSTLKGCTHLWNPFGFNPITQTAPGVAACAATPGCCIEPLRGSLSCSYR